MAAIAILVALAFVLDPRGIVAPVFAKAPRLCADGVGMAPREFKPFLALPHQPREILVGNSRVQNGFAAGDAEALLRTPTLNLAIDAARFEEVEGLVRQAWSVAPVERVWIGIDYVMFINRSKEALPLPAPIDRRLHALRYGAADPTVIRTVVEYLVGGEGCRYPARTRLGFRHPINSMTPKGWWIENRADRMQVWRGHQIVVQTQIDFHGSHPAAARTVLRHTRQSRLRRLVQEARARNIEVVLFIGPSHPELIERLSRAGMLEDHETWRREMAAMVAAEGHSGLVLVDISDDAAIVAAARRWPCTEGSASGCPFHDLTHYETPIGRQILERGIAAPSAVDGSR